MAALWEDFENFENVFSKKGFFTTITNWAVLYLKEREKIQMNLKSLRVYFKDNKKLRGIFQSFNWISLLACLHHHIDAYKIPIDYFEVLFELNSLNIPGICICVAKLATLSQQNFDHENFAEDLHNSNSLYRISQINFPTTPLKDLKHSDLLPLLLTVNIALRIFLTLPVTNCAGENTVSRIAGIKN